MTIPIFNNGDLLKNVRENSLNPAIARVNQLSGSIEEMEARLGVTPSIIHTLDDIHPTGWYYFQPPAVGPVPEGFVQYYTLYAEEHVPTYSRCTLYSRGGHCKIYLRDWSQVIHWGEWLCLGAGGFRLDPNPGVEGQNYFKGNNRAAAEAARDAALTGDTLAPYDQDSMLLIMLEWTDAGRTIAIFQGRSSGKWIEPFGEIATEFQLGNHDAAELRDWSTWSQKIFAAAKSLNNVGSDTGVEIASLVGGALSVSKMGVDGTVVPHKASDGTVNFYTKGFWVGYFDTEDDLNGAVPAAVRIPTVTTAAVKDGHSGYVTKVWTGTAWESTVLIGGGLYEDSSSRKHGYQYLKDGPNITFSLASATGALQANVKDVMTSADVADFLKKEQLHAGEWITLNTTAGTDNVTIDGKPTPTEFKNYIKDDESDVVATTSSEGSKIKLNFVQPKLKAQVSNILKTGNNDPTEDLLRDSDTITFTKDIAGGRDVIKANVVPKEGTIQGKVGSSVNYTSISKISATSPYASITNGVLTIPHINGKSNNGTEIGAVNAIKAGSNITLTSAGGDLVIASTAKQNFTAQIGGGAIQTITGINISNPYATISLGKLNLPVISAVDTNGAEIAKIKNLKQGNGISLTNASGVITINATGGGGGGGTPLVMSGKTTEGTAITNSQINKITLGEGITFSETPSNQEAKITALLEVTGKDLDEASKPTVTEKVTKIEFGDGLDTEVVSEAGKPSYAKIKAVNSFKASASGGTKPIEMKPVDQLLVVGDAASSYISEVDGKQQLTIETYTPVLSETDKASLDTNHPAADNTDRLGFVSSNEQLFIASGGQWKDLCYAGMGSHIASMLNRFKERLPIPGEAYDENQHREVRITSISAQSAKDDLGLPEETSGVLFNIYGGKGSGDIGAEGHWIQKFYCFETGEEYIRYRATTSATPPHKWSQWRKFLVVVGGLTDANHSVLVMDNDVKLSGLLASGQIPYLLHTDPTSNIVLVSGNKGAFQVVRGGTYNIQCLVQFTNEPNQNITGENAYIELRKEGVSTPIANVDFPKSEIFNDTSKEYFPMLGKFNNVTLELGATYSVKVVLRNASAADKNRLRFDPYKNIMSIDPSTSRAKTGANTLNMLYRTMSGFSYSTGNEIRTESSGSTVRVFGEKYLSVIKERVSN